MAQQLKDSVLPRALFETMADLADLVQKEMQLARAELSAKLSISLRAGIWMLLAAGFAMVAGLLIVEALVFGIAAFGLALHWSCVIVAAVMAVAGAIAYAIGRADARQELLPGRTIRQVKLDIATAKEQLR
jgi:hypothetical protein